MQPPMPPQSEPEQSIGELVKDVSTHFSTVLHGEIELAKLEVKSSVSKIGFGAIYLVVAAVLGLFSLVFLFIGAAELLAWFGFFRWVAYAIVFGGLILFVILFALLGIRKLKKVRAPERTIATTKSTVEALRHRGGTAGGPAA
jgi:uncharacterized membrane protein YqjE